ncbi:unnamed protein product, partial [Tenebrio molitor]
TSSTSAKTKDAYKSLQKGNMRSAVGNNSSWFSGTIHSQRHNFQWFTIVGLNEKQYMNHLGTPCSPAYGILS